MQIEREIAKDVKGRSKKAEVTEAEAQSFEIFEYPRVALRLT
jgi:hypothetical protein|tara:strand:+ start:843 stop:968 length:126 start_codon:yes stop_codon:yes gene_type:complete